MTNDILNEQKMERIDSIIDVLAINNNIRLSELTEKLGNDVSAELDCLACLGITTHIKSGDDYIITYHGDIDEQRRKESDRLYG